MQFRISNKMASKLFFKGQLIYNAAYIALQHKLLPSEIKLNNYLIKTYKKDLKTIAVMLVQKCKLLHNYTGEAIIIFPNKADDTLAQLITYGNIEFNGSNILKDLFFRKE